MPDTGETPGKGKYTCENCRETLTLDKDKDRLPPLPGMP